MNDIQPLLDLAVRIQQIPAPTFHERARGLFVRGLFIKEGLKDVSTDSAGNVYARLPGRRKKAKALVVSAHMDTVFPPGISLRVRKEARRIIAPGIGDNSLGVAALVGIIRQLRKQKIQLPHDLWLAADVGEEGLGNLRGMRAVVRRFGKRVLGYLVLEGLALGHVYHKAVGVRRYRITVKTRGGHSWSDYGKPSAVHELAALAAQLTALQLPREPRTTMNIGTFHGGMGVNVLASEAKCELDLRSEDGGALADWIRRVEEVLIRANREGVQVMAEVIGERPAGAISVDHPLIRLAVDCLEEQGVGAALTAGSTDANIPLSLGLPAVVMGITTGGGAHTMEEFIDVEPVAKGMRSVVRFVELVGDE
jgi:acetylornithine deacetylase/succinyl-diaminopimelate desuccinylase-like protein